jgi:hypothetical protein
MAIEFGVSENFTTAIERRRTDNIEFEGRWLGSLASLRI